MFEFGLGLLVIEQNIKLNLQGPQGVQEGNSFFADCSSNMVKVLILVKFNVPNPQSRIMEVVLSIGGSWPYIYSNTTIFEDYRSFSCILQVELPLSLLTREL